MRGSCRNSEIGFGKDEPLRGKRDIELAKH